MARHVALRAPPSVAPLNRVLTAYDKNGNVTKITREDDSQDTGIEADKTTITEMVYDARNRRVSKKDKIGASTYATTVFAYGKRKRPTPTRSRC